MSTRPDEPAHTPEPPRRPDHPAGRAASAASAADGARGAEGAEGTDADPTHALDDFLRRMRPASGWRADDGDPTDLSSLNARLHPGHPGASVRPLDTAPTKAGRGGVLRNGGRWHADDVTDVPVVELPRVPAGPPPAVDDGAWQDIGRQARVAAQQAAATHGADWQPDPLALQLRHAVDPRVLPHWQPGAWIGAQRQVLQASTELVHAPAAGHGAQAAPVVESHDAQRLLLLWAPPGLDGATAPTSRADGRADGQMNGQANDQEAAPSAGPAPFAGRWPRQVLLAPMHAAGLAGHGAASVASAAEALLAARPPEAADAPLWLNPDPTQIDWALAAEIALHHLPDLRPVQIDGLRAFIAAEREASFARVNDGYGAVPGGALARPG